MIAAEVLQSTGAVMGSTSLGIAIDNILAQLLQLVFLLLATGTSYGVKLWINHMQSGWKKTVVERFVKYAEDKFIAEAGSAKYEWVSKAVSNHFPRLSQDEVAHLISEAVINLKAQLDAPKGAV